MNQEEHLINGELLRLRREAKGWVVNDMATRACLSTKQVRQLEEGGSSAFYSESVKTTAAKKVGALLGLSLNEVFVSSTTSSAEEDVPVHETPKPDVDSHHAIDAETVSSVHTEETVAVASVSELPAHEEPKPKTSIWAIAGLFAAALAVAAYMQPKEEAPVEAAPPLQVVPSDADAAASAADAASASASAASDAVAPVSQKAGSAPAVAAVAATPAASAPAVRPVNAASGVQPAAPAASKAP
jgi:transcriptional regulator with XRE-family HTH domain